MSIRRSAIKKLTFEVQIPLHLTFQEITSKIKQLDLPYLTSATNFKENLPKQLDSVYLAIKQDKLKDLKKEKRDLEKRLLRKNILESLPKRSVLENIYKALSAEVIAVDGVFVLTRKGPNLLCIEKDIKEDFSEEEIEMVSYYFNVCAESFINSLISSLSH